MLWLAEMIRLRDCTKYSLIVRSLSRRPFVSLIERDENRALDGIEFRREYEVYAERRAPSGPCSVLEVLIGLAKRMAYISYDPDLNDDDQITEWFWEMIHNLRLDPGAEVKENMDKIDFWIEREFDKDGRGSPFPLQNVTKDQRTVELWYQMQAYISEKL